MHNADDFVMCLSDFYGNVDRHIDGFDGAIGGYGTSPRNLEGRMLHVSGERIICVKYMI